MRAKRSPLPYIAAFVLGILLFLVSGGQREHFISNLLFSLASGALIIGLALLLANMKMFASFSWGTRFLKRLFLGRTRSGRAETEDYAAYRNSRPKHGGAAPLLIAAAVLTALSFVVARLT